LLDVTGAFQDALSGQTYIVFYDRKLNSGFASSAQLGMTSDILPMDFPLSPYMMRHRKIGWLTLC
jgi:hypothetical protein